MATWDTLYSYLILNPRSTTKMGDSASTSATLGRAAGSSIGRRASAATARTASSWPTRTTTASRSEIQLKKNWFEFWLENHLSFCLRSSGESSRMHTRNIFRVGHRQIFDINVPLFSPWFWYQCPNSCPTYFNWELPLDIPSEIMYDSTFLS